MNRNKKKEIENLQKRANDALNDARRTMNPNPHNPHNPHNPPLPTTPTPQKINAHTPQIMAKSKNQIEKTEDEDPETKYTIENLITNLKIISNIKTSEKIYMNENNIIEIDKSICPAVTRYFNDRSRNITISFLKEIVLNVLICTDSILTNEQDDLECDNDYNSCTLSNDFTEYNSDILQRFILEINKSFNGLDNLIKTYESDVTVISEITVMKEKLSTRCVKINNILRIKKIN